MLFNLIDLLELLLLTSLHKFNILIVIITALKSNNERDKRSHLHMETVRSLIDLGAEIWFEEDTGRGINISNEEFVQAGLKKHTREECLKNGD